MELYDKYFEIFTKNLDEVLLTERLMDIHWSLKEAVRLEQYLEFHQDGKIIGFFTWIVCPNIENPSKVDIAIENLCIIRSARGTYSLLPWRHYLRGRYPNLAKTVWISNKRGKQIDILKRGCHEHIEEQVAC
jgi:hypothetical protein